MHIITYYVYDCHVLCICTCAYHKQDVHIVACTSIQKNVISWDVDVHVRNARSGKRVKGCFRAESTTSEGARVLQMSALLRLWWPEYVSGTVPKTRKTRLRSRLRTLSSTPGLHGASFQDPFHAQRRSTWSKKQHCNMKQHQNGQNKNSVVHRTVHQLCSSRTIPWIPRIE